MGTHREVRTQASPPAIVLGGGIGALAVLRALRRLTNHVYVVAREGDLIWRSRFAKRLPVSVGCDFPPSALAEVLNRLELAEVVLFPCTDHWAVSVAGLSDELRSRAQTSSPSLATVQACVDKARFAETVARCCVPAPFTKIVADERDLAAAGRWGEVEYCLKPRDSQSFFSRFRVKAFRVRSCVEARELLQECIRVGEAMILQEVIPGGAEDNFLLDGFCTAGGTLKGLFVRQRLRFYPEEFGNPSFMRSVSPEKVSEARKSLEKLLRALHYRGLFMAEFKRDPRDGVFRVIEINARAWWYIGFAVALGVDVVAMAYADSLGLEVAPVFDYPVGATCMYPYYDFCAFRSRRRSALEWARWGAAAVRSYQPVLSLRDPWPAIAGVQEIVRRKLGRLW